MSLGESNPRGQIHWGEGFGIDELFDFLHNPSSGLGGLGRSHRLNLGSNESNPRYVWEETSEQLVESLRKPIVYNLEQPLADSAGQLALYKQKFHQLEEHHDAFKTRFYTYIVNVQEQMKTLEEARAAEERERNVAISRMGYYFSGIVDAKSLLNSILKYIADEEEMNVTLRGVGDDIRHVMDELEYRRRLAEWAILREKDPQAPQPKHPRNERQEEERLRAEAAASVEPEAAAVISFGADEENTGDDSNNASSAKSGRGQGHKPRARKVAAPKSAQKPKRAPKATAKATAKSAAKTSAKSKAKSAAPRKPPRKTKG